MHPVEHVLYFSGVLIHFVVPAAPVIIIFQLVHAGLAPAPGHLGFDKMLVSGPGGVRTVNSGAFNHYLHHKYFECNYSDGVFPLDKWFGTFNDGSPEARAAMKERLARRNPSAAS
jgi:sterol desaturase/sphingolipid hydroxylase (fatty acid hydroxylase superfamily)